MRVLIADDNSEIRSALCLVLQELWPGCEVYEAPDGTAARRSLATTAADVVLLDWELPGLDAPGFVGEMRRRLPKCSTIAMCSRPEARKQSLAAGAAYFVGKNDPPERLLDLLRRLGAPEPTVESPSVGE